MDRIESVDFFYLSMPEILDIGDGSQDMLLVRVQSGEWVGWGESDASPLVTITSLVTPMSHSACKPVRDSVLGQKLDSPEDIRRIGDLVRANSLDLLQVDHALAGIDIAMWDLLGKKRGEPVYRLLGWDRSNPKTPYASVLFGDTPSETFAKAVSARQHGHVAAKFGWGPFGLGSVAEDEEQVQAAREGLGKDAKLMVDVGTVWIDDMAKATARMPSLDAANVTWLEEPFVTGALGAYKQLADASGSVRLAGGEGAHNWSMAKQLIDFGGIGFVQIDATRIGITTAHDVATYANQRGVTYVNHTFNSHLALAASLAPFAGLEDDVICEYPVESKPLAVEITKTRLNRDGNGQVSLPDTPGIGVEVDIEAASRYLVDTEIRVAGKTIYSTPSVWNNTGSTLKDHLLNAPDMSDLDLSRDRSPIRDVDLGKGD